MPQEALQKRFPKLDLACAEVICLSKSAEWDRRTRGLERIAGFFVVASLARGVVYGTDRAIASGAEVCGVSGYIKRDQGELEMKKKRPDSKNRVEGGTEEEREEPREVRAGDT